MRLVALLFFVLSTPAFSAQFTDDFKKFLVTNYADYDFSGARAGVNSAFGGKTAPGQTTSERPIILVHGSTDRAVGGHAGGWQVIIAKLEEQGLTSADIYALTWGDGSQGSAVRNNHSPAALKTVRKFIEAVLAYTDAPAVDIVGHSMGVTLSRAALKGGTYQGTDLGASLGEKVKTFIAIAAANKGVGTCLNPFTDALPTCSKTIGFHPSSAFLAQLNSNPTREAERVYSIWSRDDDLLNRPVFTGSRNPVPSEVTCPVPGEDLSFPFDRYTHNDVRDLTFETIWSLLSQD